MLSYILETKCIIYNNNRIIIVLIDFYTPHLVYLQLPHVTTIALHTPLHSEKTPILEQYVHALDHYLNSKILVRFVLCILDDTYRTMNIHINNHNNHNLRKLLIKRSIHSSITI